LRGEKAEQSESLKELQKYIDKDEEEDYDAMVADGVDVITLSECLLLYDCSKRC
jgi:hypothetical protein